MKKNAIFLEPYHYTERADAFKGQKKRKGAPSIEQYFGNYFGKKAIVTPNGRMAIAVVLASLNLKSDDEVYITTTFEKPNVSSCVTSTIFNFCRPSRVLTDKARAIFIIHEFGVPHPRTESLAALTKERGIPLIEDCAHTIDSRHSGKTVGQTGDYTICSFAKIFPLRHGGLLIGENITYTPTAIQARTIDEVRRLLPRYMHSIGEYSDRKRANFRSLKEKFKKISLEPIHEVSADISPSLFFPLITDRFEGVLKKMSESRIECGLWHGTNIVVLPVHQFLEKEDLERIFETVKTVYENGD